MGIRPTEKALRGHDAMITAAPYYNVCMPGVTHAEVDSSVHPIGQTVLLLDDAPDDIGNIRTYHAGPLDSSPERMWVQELAAECLTLIPRYLHINRDPLSDITPEVAAHVLYRFTGNGYRAGSFITHLMDAIAAADPGNRALIAIAYPGYAHAINYAQNEAGGIEVLTAIQRRER